MSFLGNTGKEKKKKIQKNSIRDSENSKSNKGIHSEGRGIN